MSERFSGTVEIVDGQGRQVFKFDSSFAVLDLGATAGNAGDLRIRGADGQFKIHLDGSSGDIKLSGADCAEEFEVDEEEELEPGSVMAIADEGKLRRCAQAYDRRVAGVISGAGSHKPGIILGRRRQGSEGGNSIPLALSGRAYCRVDAEYGPVGVGDLLTTSPTVGHAMRAEDPRRAFGATIGKALRPLRSGTGLVPILIALQ
jgi:hypothetical protein